MTVALRQIGAISKITMLEGARKQIFHVLMLFAMTLIAIATALAFFDHNIDIRIVKDLCLVAILVSSGIIAITMSVSGIPGEIESKTVYPILAKPMARWKFVVGKYAGTMGTVAIGMGLLLVALCGILLMFVGKIDPGVLFVIPYLLLEAAILAAVAMCLSTVTSPALAWFVSLVIYVCGNMKFALCDFISTHAHTVLGTVSAKIMYSVLPNLECFNFKDSMVHSIPVPPLYLAQTAAYGLLYIAFLLTLASTSSTGGSFESYAKIIVDGDILFAVGPFRDGKCSRGRGAQANCQAGSHIVTEDDGHELANDACAR